MKAIIAGAGVGGLALALMLHRRGVESVVFEQASEIREVGVGINILPHAIKELAALGLLPALDAVGIRTKELHYVSRLGQKVWSELRGTDAGFDYPQFSIHRGRLQKVIYDAVSPSSGPAPIRTGLKLQGFLQDEGGVVAHFTDAKSGLASETVRGDVLIGADGIHSVVRRHFYPKRGPPELAGAYALARRGGMAEVPDRPLDVYRRRHERQDRALPDRAGLDAGHPPHQLGDRLAHRRRRRSRRRRPIPGRASGAWTR